MKKPFGILGLLVVVCTLSLPAQQFNPGEYLQIRQQNQFLTAAGLENRYSRPTERYLKGFENPVDFKNAHYLDSLILKFELTGEELSLLKQNLFFVTERLSFSNFGHAFHEVYNRDLPVFISTDAILHALHMSYDKILKTLEREIMAGNLEVYLKSLYEGFGSVVKKYGDEPLLRDALSDADLFITIAYSLICDQLFEGHVVPVEVLKGVWDAIGSEKMVEMPLFTFPSRHRRVDFSQFTVRGHYVYTTADKWQGFKSLEPYFRTMMWLGRIDFLLTAPPENPWDTPWSFEEIQRMHQGAFILNEVVQLSPRKGLLDWNEQVITFLVGASDNLTPSAYQRVLSTSGVKSAFQLTDSVTVARLREALGSDPDLAQKILSDFYMMDPWGEAPGELPVSYRLSGQRFIIDADILGSVVFDRVMHNGQKVMRMMPDPLDILFVLGNNDVLPLLEVELQRYPYQGQLANLRWLTDTRPGEFWEQSLYNVWLNAIRELNPGLEERNLPLFMQTAAWHQEKINTQLASWSHLRHDNLLYAKQSYTGGTGCSFPYSYVEPYPAFFGRLKQFAQSAAFFFRQLPVDNPEIELVREFFPRFEEIMEKLERLAYKELKGMLFSEEENQWLKTMLFRNGKSGDPPYNGWHQQLFFDPWDASEGNFTVVDVHTQPTDENGNIVGNVLHTAVGQVNLGVFLVNTPATRGQLMAFTGPVMSYYETVTSQFKRMTDEEWEEMVWKNEVPERPGWTNIYLAGAKGNLKGAGPELPSAAWLPVSSHMTEASSFMVYPNPVSNKLTLSFRVDDPAGGMFTLYNSAGTVVRQMTGNYSVSGENTIQLDMHDLPPGIYILRMALTDQKPEVRKIIKR